MTQPYLMNHRAVQRTVSLAACPARFGKQLRLIVYVRKHLTMVPLVLLAPACIIILTTFALSILGDRLRDRVDPTFRGQSPTALWAAGNKPPPGGKAR
jgi:hypothetical protein